MLRNGCRRDRRCFLAPRPTRLPVAWIVPFAVAIAGCSSSSDSLQGTVTYNGEPVQKGSIVFLSSDGEGPGFSVQVRDGTYATDQPRLGRHVAVVRGLEESTTSSKEEFIRQREQKNNPHNLPVDYIPEDATGNSQTVDISGGEQTLDFALQGPPRSG